LHFGHELLAHGSQTKAGGHGGMAGPQRCAQYPPLNTQTSSPIVVPHSAWDEHGVTPDELLTALLAFELPLDALLDALDVAVLPAPPPPSFSTTTVPLQATRIVDEAAPAKKRKRMAAILLQRVPSSR
jgi:hypothetical protein